MKRVYVKALMTDEEADKWAGVLLKQEDCKMLFRESVDVYDKDTKQCIAKFRKDVIPPGVQIAAFNALLKAAAPTLNRGMSTGKQKGAENSSAKMIRKDGKVSKTTQAAGGAVNSGIVGYFDRTTRTPYCRLTAFNQKEFSKFKKAYPIIKLVDLKYRELMPAEYGRQREMADKTSKDFVIPDTAFTTVTVNKNWQTAVHKDAGDFTGGFGNLVAIRKGNYSGGHFVVVKWGVGFDLHNGDLLLADVHQWHGNTPIIKEDKKAVRLSLVMYYRENMIHCGTMAQELKRAKTRKHGTPLN